MSRTMFKSLCRSKYPDILILLLIVLFAQWQLIFGSYILKWDNLDVYLPWKHYISEAINQGILPLWNPFMNGGFIQYADPGTWYPVSWIFGIGGYNIYSLHSEFVFHTFWAGMGMYFLIIKLYDNRPIAITLAASFMLSGFFTSNAQHLGWLVGASWIPWLTISYLNLRTKPLLINSLLLGLASYMMLTGGYPAITIVSGYCMMVWIIVDLFFLAKGKQFFELKKRMQYLFISALFLSLLGGVVFISLYHASVYLNKGTALAMREGVWSIMYGGFTVESFSSLLFPLVLSTPKLDWNTNVCFLNIYIGFFVFATLFLTISKTSKRSFLFILLSILMFLIAMGDILYLREWLTVFPFLDTFRFPAIFRLWGMFFLLLFIAENWSISVLNTRKWLIFSIVASTLFSSAMLFDNFRKSISLVYAKVNELGYDGFVKAATILELVSLNILIVLVLSVLFLIIMLVNRKPRVNILYVFILFSFVDIAFLYRLNIPSFVGDKMEVRSLALKMSELPRDYQVPDNTVPIKTFDKGNRNRPLPHLWQNMAIYEKIPSLSGNNPYSFKGHKELYKSGQYRAWADSSFVFTDKKVKSLSLGVLYPNEFTINVELNDSTEIFVQQHYSPYWSIEKDGLLIVPTKNLNGLMSFVAPSSGEYRFSFNPLNVRIAFYSSLLTFIAAMIYITFYLLKIKKPH